MDYAHSLNGFISLIEGDILHLSRGVGPHSPWAGHFYTPDTDFAIQFTQSGRSEELRHIAIDSDLIYGKEDPVDATDEKAMDARMYEVQQMNEYIGFWVSEGGNNSDSVFLIDPEYAVLFNRDMDPDIPLHEGIQFEPSGYDPGDKPSSMGWGFWLAPNGKIHWCYDLTGRHRHTHHLAATKLLGATDDEDILSNFMDSVITLQRKGYKWGLLSRVGVHIYQAYKFKGAVPINQTQLRTLDALSNNYDVPINLEEEEIGEAILQDRRDKKDKDKIWTDYVNPTNREWSEVVQRVRDFGGSNEWYRGTTIWNTVTDEWITTSDPVATHRMFLVTVKPDWKLSSCVFMYAYPKAIHGRQLTIVTIGGDIPVEHVTDLILNSDYYRRVLKPGGWRFSCNEIEYGLSDEDYENPSPANPEVFDHSLRMIIRDRFRQEVGYSQNSSSKDESVDRYVFLVEQNTDDLIRNLIFHLTKNWPGHKPGHLAIAQNIVAADPVADRTGGKKAPFIKHILRWWECGTVDFPEDIHIVRELLDQYQTARHEEGFKGDIANYDSPGALRRDLGIGGEGKWQDANLTLVMEHGSYKLWRIDNWEQGELALADSGWCVRDEDVFEDYTYDDFLWLVTEGNKRRFLMYNPVGDAGPDIENREAQIMDVYNDPIVAEDAEDIAPMIRRVFPDVEQLLDMDLGIGMMVYGDEAEEIVKNNPWQAYWWAAYHMGARWIEAEPIIRKDADAWHSYIKVLYDSNIGDKLGKLNEGIDRLQMTKLIKDAIDLNAPSPSLNQWIDKEEELASHILDADPVAVRTENKKTPFVKKILSWLILRHIDLPEDIMTMRDLLTVYQKAHNEHGFRHINTFNDPGTLRAELQEGGYFDEEGGPADKWDRMGLNKVAEANGFSIYQITEWEDGEKAFANSGWCVQHQETFEEYTTGVTSGFVGKALYMVTQGSKRVALIHPATRQFMDVHNRLILMDLAKQIAPAVRKVIKLPQIATLTRQNLPRYSRGLLVVLAIIWGKEVLTHPGWAFELLSAFSGNTFLKGEAKKTAEKTIAQDEKLVLRYVDEVIKDRFLEGEKTLFSTARLGHDHSYRMILKYARLLKTHRKFSGEIQDKIEKHILDYVAEETRQRKVVTDFIAPDLSEFAQEIRGNRWEEAEPFIKKDEEIWNDYKTWWNNVVDTMGVGYQGIDYILPRKYHEGVESIKTFETLIHPTTH